MISRCEQGHDEHPTVVASIDFSTEHIWHDYPQIPWRFKYRWDMEVFMSDLLPDRGGYCPGICSVSKTIRTHRLWEPVETIALLNCFEWTDLFIDFGANLGYYSTMAKVAGLDVIAVEGDADIFEILSRNLVSVDEPVDSEAVLFWLESDPLDFGRIHPEVRVTAKMDVEGAEPAAFKTLAPIISQVDFILAEISPVFHDGYPQMVTDIMNEGFVVAMMPVKSSPPPRFNDLGDLAWRNDTEAFTSEVAGWRQENVLFARPEVLA